jgi:hypothetical protein
MVAHFSKSKRQLNKSRIVFGPHLRPIFSGVSEVVSAEAQAELRAATVPSVSFPNLASQAPLNTIRPRPEIS